MHVVQISFFVDPERRSPSKLLEDWFSLTEIADAVRSAGVRVTVIQASMVPGRIERSGVTYHFVSPNREGIPLTKRTALSALLRDLAPNLFHVHGLGFSREVIELHDLAPHIPILLQDHADRVPRIWKRGNWRRSAAAAAGISFCARAQAEPFYRARLLGADTQIFEISESTSSFEPGDAAAARAATGIHGNPAVLWVGHLNRNKDPLTALNGVSAAARNLPELQLWCCYASSPLLSDVQIRIANDSALRDRVHLLGRIPHEKMEQHMRAADLFVLGSHREGSSVSVIEALATGLTPVVTDIPSLRALTGGGAVGALWPKGDWRSLGEAMRTTTAELGPNTRSIVRAHFDTYLSSSAIGEKFAAAYCRLADIGSSGKKREEAKR